MNVRNSSVFLNVPYDRQFNDQYLAYIAGLTALGLTPKLAVEQAEGRWRVDKILSAVRECRFSVHDLSTFSSKKTAAAIPKLNVAFELGITVTLSQLEPNLHDWFVFAPSRARLKHSLSDIDGADPLIHRGTLTSIFRQLLNAFDRGVHAPTIAEMESIHRYLRVAATELRTELRTANLFQASLFKRLAVMARVFVDVRAESRD